MEVCALPLCPASTITCQNPICNIPHPVAGKRLNLLLEALLAEGVALNMHVLHNLVGAAHMDVKLDNILVFITYAPYFEDLGVADGAFSIDAGGFEGWLQRRDQVDKMLEAILGNPSAGPIEGIQFQLADYGCCFKVEKASGNVVGRKTACQGAGTPQTYVGPCTFPSHRLPSCMQCERGFQLSDATPYGQCCSQ
jgi:hypothetical protein